jgi:PAS domain S-box-containing protein
MVVNITLKHGHTPQVGYSYTAFAGLLGWVDNDYATGKELVDLATQLMSKPMASPSDQAVFHLMVGSSARHWYQHLACSSQDYAEAYRVGVQSGNLQYAAYAFGHNMYCCFFQGMELEQLIHESKISLEFSHTRKNQWAIDLLEGGISLFSRMSSQGFTEHCVDENEFLQRVRRHRNEQVECIYWVIKCQMCLILGEKELAIESAERAEELIHMVGTQGLLPWPEHLFSCFLLLVTSDVNISRGSREKKDDTLRRLVTQLSHWEASCPDNFECKSLLARAEMAFRDSKYDQAAELYDRSIESARNYGFIHWEGYANERASLLWRSLGRHRVEQFYWQQAFECFYRWGAVAKVTAMGVEFRDYLKDLTVGSPATDSLLASHSPQLSPAMIESRVEQFVKQSSDATMLRHQAARASSVDELADAASNLRIDVAARRKVSDELRRERDQQLKLNDELERRVRERTAALSKAEFRFRNLLESAPIAMVMVDIEGNISLVNSETEQLFGCSRDQLIDSPVHHVFDAATATTADGFHDAAFGALRELSEKDGQTCMFRRRDDTLFPGELGLRSVMIDDSRFLLCAIKDITEQQQTIATAQRAREAAESANRAKSTFLATMSHEIRTPMNGVLGTCELALSTDLTEEQRGYLKTMQRSATSLLDVISDILDLSKIEAGKLELQSQPFSPNQVLVDAFQLLKTNAELNGILMECHIESSIDTPVLGDSGRLRQVLINLIGNAIKFTHAGKVALSSRITGTIGNHVRVNFSVEDTGVGIPPDKLETIFEPFSQIDDSDHRRYGGTGLGLSISSKLVQLMGGTLEARSQLGAGTNFTFELGFEAASRAVPSQTEPTAVASAVSSIRILLAEDDTTNVLVAKTLLTRWGHEVSVAKNGREAIAMFQTYPYDLILMDVQMPGLDGLEATRGIRVLEEGSGNRIPIVALTAGAMEGDREACLEAGMTDYLAKPVHWAKLNEIIKSLEPVEAKDMPQSKPEMGQLSWDLGSALEEMAVEVAVLREAFEAVLDNLDTQVITLSDARLACDRRAMSDTMDRLHESAQILKLSWLENLVADLQRALSTEDWGAVDFNIELLKNGMPRLKTILTEFANQQCC